MDFPPAARCVLVEDAEFDASCLSGDRGPVLVRFPLSRYGVVTDLAFSLLLSRWSALPEPARLIIEPVPPHTDRSGIAVATVRLDRFDADQVELVRVLPVNAKGQRLGWYATPDVLVSVRLGMEEALTGLVGNRRFDATHCAGDVALLDLVEAGSADAGAARRALLRHEVAVLAQPL